MGETFKTALAEAQFEAAVNDLVYEFSETVETNLTTL
jgi:nitrate/nitrite-specific signal transduction histidine kinase